MTKTNLEQALEVLAASAEAAGVDHGKPWREYSIGGDIYLVWPIGLPLSLCRDACISDFGKLEALFGLSDEEGTELFRVLCWREASGIDDQLGAAHSAAFFQAIRARDDALLRREAAQNAARLKRRAAQEARARRPATSRPFAGLLGMM